MDEERQVRVKVRRLDGSIAYSETPEEQLARLEKMIVDRVEMLENNISKSAIPQISEFRDRLIDEELQNFFFNEIIPEFGRIRWRETESEIK